MNDALTWLTHWLADVLLLGSALLLLAHGLFWIVRQPGHRMTLAWGTLLGLLALMVLAALPLWPRQSLLPAQRGDPVRNELDRDANVVLAVAAATPPVVELSPPPIIGLPSPRDVVPAPQAEIASVEPIEPGQSPLVVGLLRAWLGGAALALGWIALGAWQAARLLRRSQESPVWTRQELAQLVAKRRQPRLLVSPRVATAVALGASCPHILLPAASVQPENAAGVRAALAHEWAHIRHGDLWLLALERLLLPIFFWHPLFWLFRRRVRFDQELLADAAAAGEQPVEYAEALLAWAKSAVALPARPPWGMAALSLWENPRSLTRRVEMILQADPTQTGSVSRPWRFFVLTSLLAAVLGLSLITLRPTATAQEGVDQLADRASKKDSAKKKKQKKARDEARAAASLDARIYSDPATAEADRVRAGEIPIQMDLMVYELAREELTVAEIDLGVFLQETSRECRAEDHVIIADYTQERLQGMLQRLSKEPGVEILSRPKVITLSDQEARVQIGSEIPFVLINETVNGKTNSRVESLNAGIELSITPHLHPGHKVALEIVLERAQVQPGNKAADDAKSLPVLRRRKVQVDTEVLLGETVVIAERARTSKGEKPGPILLLIVTPTQPVARTSQASPNTTAQLAFLPKEAQVRAEAVEREGTQMQLAVQRGLEWLRKHQAGDQADELERVAHPHAESTIKLLVQLLKQHDGDQLADELEREVQALRLRRLEMEAANYRDGVDLLHKENDQLRKQVAQLQQKLLDAQVQLAWLRDAATAEGREKVSDEAFLRRVYLDLMGVPPTVEEAKAFLNDKDADKRSKLIDRLLNSTKSRAFLDGTWKNLFQQKGAANEPAANPPASAAEGEQRVVKVFALRDTPAERVMDVIKQLQQEGKTRIELQGITPDERTNSILVAGKEADLVIIGNVIAALDKAGAPPDKSPKNDPSSALTQRLNALDVREAEINLRAAQANLERVQAIAKTSPAAIPQQEVLAAQIEAEKAAITLESIKAGGDPLAKQKLELRLAEVRLRAAQTHLERITTIVKEGGATQLELTAAQFEVEKAAIDLERAKARLEATQAKE